MANAGGQAEVGVTLPEASDSPARPRPRIAGIVNDPSVQSRDIEDYMREHWRPE